MYLHLMISVNDIMALKMPCAFDRIDLMSTDIFFKIFIYPPV